MPNLVNVVIKFYENLLQTHENIGLQTFYREFVTDWNIFILMSWIDQQFCFDNLKDFFLIKKLCSKCYGCLWPSNAFL